MIKRILLLFMLCGVANAATIFDESGVWKAIESSVLAAGRTVNFGPQNMTQRDGYINVLAYGVTVGDSLKLTITIYGMMGYSNADTLHAVQLSTITLATTGKVVTLADTLDGTSLYPYLWGKVKNNHASASVTLNVYLYSRPLQTTSIQ